MQQAVSDVTVDERFARLREIAAEVADLRSTAALLSWDQETYMPRGGAEARAQQISTIRKLAHERFTTDELGTLLNDLEGPSADLEPHSREAAMVRVIRRDYDKATRLSSDLVARLARAVSRGKEAWREARSADRFASFAPHLERLVDLNVEKAEAYGYEHRLYDALLDEYEPGMKKSLVDEIFAELRDGLIPLVDAIAAEEPIDDAALHQRFDSAAQWAFGEEVIRDFGYDFERGRQDLSTHPFTTTFSIGDVRITTRVSEDHFSPALFSTLHEAGHALYEQGIEPALERTLLADGASLALHESQSRLWENLIGRSRPFWQRYYPRLQSIFPERLSNLPLDRFYRAINRVEPGPIRVEADEVTYNLHIMLRFEIEDALLEGTIDTADLPEIWRAKMKEYLGVTPESDAVGVLQDIHWSLGAFGYFPTYALGNLMSTQIFEKASRDIPGIDEHIAEGRFAELLAWLREHVHRHGRTMDALEILEQATGRGLGAGSWLGYIRRKYGQLYPGISRIT